VQSLYCTALQRDLNDLLAFVLVVIPRCVMHPPESAVHLPVATDGVTPRNNAQQDQSEQQHGRQREVVDVFPLGGLAGSCKQPQVAWRPQSGSERRQQS